MLFFEGLLALVRRSLGTVVRAIFGWATLALFGEVPAEDRTLLSIGVGAAAAWPFLALGIVFPRQAALALALLPVPKGAPEAVVRAVWIALTVLTPIGVGAILARDARDPARGWRRLWLGFPATLGLAAAFLVACVAVPAGKLAALAARRQEEHVALVIPPERYAETVRRLWQALEHGGMDLAPTPPPWATRVLGTIFQAFARSLLGEFLPGNLAFLRGRDAEITIYPNGARVVGTESAAPRAHALITESAIATPALQCMSPEGQRIERRIKSLWEERERRDVVDRRAPAIARDLARRDLAFSDREILYRELLQVVVASRGASRLIETALGRVAPKPPRPASRRTALRGAARSARDYGRARLQRAAADRSTKAVETLAGRLLGLFRIGR